MQARAPHQLVGDAFGLYRRYPLLFLVLASAVIVPGVILGLRWFVVAQAAAIEREGWLPALRRSAHLSSGHYGYLPPLFIYICLLTFAPALLIGLGFDSESTSAVSFAVGVLVQIFVWSFGALITALAYFELRKRYEVSQVRRPRGPVADALLERRRSAGLGGEDEDAGQDQASLDRQISRWRALSATTRPRRAPLTGARGRSGPRPRPRRPRWRSA